MAKKMTTEEFINKARKVHGDKYDYSKVEYVNPKTRVCIICHEHDAFWQMPYSHLSGTGCPLCGKEKSRDSKIKWNKSTFIKKAKEIHVDKYDYSKVEFVDMKTPVIIICPEHGPFKQRPGYHLNGGGCPICAGKAKKTTEEFIEAAKKVHGNKYDYSKVEYVNRNTKVCIICPEHREFLQTPNNHLRGQGCPLCGKEASISSRRSNTEEFIKKAKEIHGDKYDYSKVEYINNNTPVIIICKVHGEFKQVPSSHLNGTGCPSCNGKFKRTNEEFRLEAIKIHGNKYDYSKVNYVNATTPIAIICPIHGEFTQTPVHHLNRKQGCPFCAPQAKKDTKRFVEESRKVHGDKYDYSKVEYKNIFKKVTIICPVHGEFQIDPHHHLLGCGCADCAKEARIGKSIYTQEEIIDKFREIHGDKYDYSKVVYKTVSTPVCIICPEHGEFLQTPSLHYGRGAGCPTCSQSHIEAEIEKFLKENNIEHENQKTFDWLKYKSNMYLDFYIPSKNIAIECQGIQHFEPLSIFGGDEGFDYNTKRDIQKRKLCEEHGIKILYYSNLGIDYPYEVIEKKEKLLEEICE